jgi:poly(3-hydroxybutyrate) depolymerase
MIAQSPEFTAPRLLTAFCGMLAVTLSIAGCSAGQKTEPAEDAGLETQTDADASSGADVADTADTDAPWEATAEPCADRDSLTECEVNGHPDRSMWVLIPDGLDLSEPVDVVVALHGGGGNAFSGLAITCPPGPNGRADLEDPSCLHRAVASAGAILVAPNGSDVGGRGAHTWNAGGGEDGWHCVSAGACLTGVDDEAYMDAVLDTVATWANVDPSRTFLTGLSNGGALTHRLACTRADRFAAIASVGSANQFATIESCDPVAPVAVLQVHGDGDACWTWETTDQSCGPGRFDQKIGAQPSAEGWADRNGCGQPTVGEPWPDDDGNGLDTVATTWSDCEADVVLWRMRGHGHTWPNGLQYQPADKIGPTDREFGPERIVGWLLEHGR